MLYLHMYYFREKEGRLVWLISRTKKTYITLYCINFLILYIIKNIHISFYFIALPPPLFLTLSQKNSIALNAICQGFKGLVCQGSIFSKIVKFLFLKLDDLLGIILSYFIILIARRYCPPVWAITPKSHWSKNYTTTF